MPTGNSTVRHRADLLTALLAAGLFALASAVGWGMREPIGRAPLFLDWPPLYAYWEAHTGPGTLAAVALAAAVVGYGPPLAARLSWRWLLLGSWLTSMAWLWSLALVDGWRRGVAGRLTAKNEYLYAGGHQGIHRFDDLGEALRTYTRYISKSTAPDNWPAHIAGHPPGAITTFVGLDRIGLGGGAWGAVFILTVAGSAAAAVLVTLRALGDEAAARRAAPFLVLAPWAVWAGVSADGYFAAVAAWALALLAVCARCRSWVAGVGAGLLLGWALYLSYGLTLLAVLVAGVLWAARTVRPVPWAALGAAVVVVGFTAAGFWWWEGYRELYDRYYEGVAADRPYRYFVWANLATVVASAGLASMAGLRRAVVAAGRGLRSGASVVRARGNPLVVLTVAAALAIAAADLSGMSKAETERIWLPFTLWLLPAAALLPPRSARWWLAAQGLAALAVNHLLITGW